MIIALCVKQKTCSERTFTDVVRASLFISVNVAWTTRATIGVNMYQPVKNYKLKQRNVNQLEHLPAVS